MQHLLITIWSNWKIGFAVTVLLAAGAGLITAWITPRGPITSSQAIFSMAIALILGILVGVLMKTRWSMVIAPLVFMLVVELARLGVKGPTVDGIHLNSTYGIIAFIFGRGVHGLLVLAPLMLGAVFGVELAAGLGAEVSSRLSAVGWMLSGVSTLLMIVIAFFLARPASTSPILGPDGEELPGSVAELISLPIGGHDQSVLIRGRSVDNPVLLYLAGGPGGTDLGAVRADAGLEEHFVVAAWDQRGAGKSYAALDPVETLTLDQMVADTVALTQYLQDRFDEDKIYLVGNSWGTILGTLTAQEHPELYHAYIGAGQMVSPKETDLMFYEDTLAWAKENGNEALIRDLEKYGLPPYENLLAYEPAISYEHAWNAYPELDMSKEMPAILFVPEYSWMDRLNAFPGFLDTFSVLYPQLQQIDFRTDVSSLDVPFYMIIGAHEARGRAVLAEEWFEMLKAPIKEKFVFEHSGHRPLFEEPGRFVSVMLEAVKDTYPVNEND